MSKELGGARDPTDTHIDRSHEFTPLLTRLRILHAISFSPFFIPNSLAALRTWIREGSFFSDKRYKCNAQSRVHKQKLILNI